jgi:hypothetical protein
MPVRFVGGPLDGKTLELDQIDALVYECPQPTKSGHRDFVTAPSFADWDRILRGVLPRDEATAYSTYERVFLSESTFEFRHVTVEMYFQAVAEAASLHKHRDGCVWWLGIGSLALIILTLGEGVGVRSIFLSRLSVAVRAAREEYCRQFDYDLAAIVRDLREREKIGGRRVVSSPLRRPTPPINTPAKGPA